MTEHVGPPVVSDPALVDAVARAMLGFPPSHPDDMEAWRAAARAAIAAVTAYYDRPPPGTTVVIPDQPSLGYRIDRIFAYLAVDAEGEGIVGWDGVPLVGADADRMLSMRPTAKAAATVSRRAVRLVRFDTRTEVEVFEP